MMGVDGGMRRGLLGQDARFATSPARRQFCDGGNSLAWELTAIFPAVKGYDGDRRVAVARSGPSAYSGHVCDCVKKKCRQCDET